MKKMKVCFLLSVLLAVEGFSMEEGGTPPVGSSPVRRGALDRVFKRNGVGAALAAIEKSEGKGDDGEAVAAHVVRSILGRQPEEAAWPLQNSLINIVVSNALSVALEFLGYEGVQGTIWDKHPAPRLVEPNASGQFIASGKRKGDGTVLGPKGTAKYGAADGSFEIDFHWNPKDGFLYTLTFINTEKASIECTPEVVGRDITFRLIPLA